MKIPLNFYINEMKAVVLSDNRFSDPRYKSEHGLSVYIDTGKLKILLDTGASDLFAQNALISGIDIKSIDYVFISHGHSDHLGGLPYFLENNDHAKVIMSSRIINQSYKSARSGMHDITTEIDYNKYSSRFIFVDNECDIENDIHIFSCDSKFHPEPLGNKNLFREDNKGELKLDDFNHELIFTYKADELFVFTGCAHKGLLNILETVKSKTQIPVKWVMGGFHLLSSQSEDPYETDENIDTIGHKMKDEYSDIKFYTGHCTGDEAYIKLNSVTGENISQFYSGFTVEF